MERLSKNDMAIDFKMKDYLDNEIILSSYKGEKVFLTFYRGATCPFCNMKIQEIIRKYSEFEKKGIKVIAFFTSSKEEMLKYVGKQKPPFVMIPDPKLKMYKKYKIETLSWGPLKTLKHPKKLFKAMFGGFFNPKAMLDEPTIPADFLIDENQKIYKTFYGKDFADHIDINEVLEWR